MLGAQAPPEVPTSGGPQPEPGRQSREVLVYLKAGAPPVDLARDLGAEFRYSLAGVSDIHVLRATDPGAARALRARALSDARVVRAYMNEFTHFRHSDWTPNDPYYPKNSPPGFPGQWHLGNGSSTTHANVVAAWARDMTGSGVLTAIVDDCLETAHPDLSPNYNAGDSWNFGNNTPDPNPNPAYNNTANEDRHGTSVAGVMAAAGDNGVGGTGAAPLASVAGLRIDFPNQTTAMFVNATLYHSSASSGSTTLKIKNHSYGYTTPYVDASAESQAVTDSAAVGTIHLYAGGNNRGTSAEDSNKTEPQNCPDQISVAAIGSNGTFASYGSFGANLFVTSPSNTSGGLGITTTDRVGQYGYNRVAGSSDGDPFPDLDYTSVFGGTSSATPLVAGIMALGKQIQPNLDVRWAKHALVRSAIQVDLNDLTATGGGDGTNVGSAWKTNAAGFKFDQNYGFGLIDADGFTRHVLLWSSITPQTTATTGTVGVGLPIPDGSLTGISQGSMLSGSQPVEDVEVALDLTHANRGQLEAYLTSPSGTTRRLFYRSSTDPNPALPWTYLTNEFWGESASGTWTVMVRDVVTGTKGTWNSYGITLRMGQPVADTTPPVVTAITATSSSPTAAAQVGYSVTFSKWVTGVLATDFVVTTTGGLSPGSIASLSGAGRNYQVVVNVGNGAGTLRLDLVDNDTIFDGAGNPLGGPGLGNGNFTSGDVYTVDRTPPTVTGLSSTAANGAYSVGAVLPITMTFSKAVNVTGTPLLTLSTGGAGTPVGYSSGSGTATLTFTYTVAAGDTSPDLDCVASTSLSLNGGTISDALGNQASLTLPAPGSPGSLGAQKALVIDTTPPSVPGAPTASVNPNQGTYTMSWAAASDGSGSGVASYTLVRSSDGGASWTTVSSGSSALLFPESALPQGIYLYKVQAVDLAGNVSALSASSVGVIDDQTAPSAPGTPSGSPNPNATGSYTLSWGAATDTGGSRVASYTVWFSTNGGAFTSLANGITGTSLAESGRSGGSYRYQVRAVDGAGNLGPWSASSPAVVVNSTPPKTTLSFRPPNPSSSAGATFIFSSNVPGCTFQTKLDGAAAWSSNGTATAISYMGLANGSHTFQVRAVDVAGNVDPSPPSYTWTINTSGGVTQAPKTILTGEPPTPTAQTTATFTFLSTEPGGTFDVQLDGGGWISNGASGTKTYTGLGRGSHTFMVRAIDTALNTDPAPPTYTWVIVGPPIDGTAPLLNPFGDDSSITNWTIAGTDASVTWAVDATPASMPGNPFFSPPNSLNYNNGTDYDTPGTSNHGTATSPSIAISGLAGARLKFFCNYQTETTGTDHDVRFVQISGDGFATLLVNEQLSTTPGSALAGGCSGMGTWHEHVIPLTGMAGPIQVRFLFDTLDAGLNNFDGWFVDDFEISDLLASGLNQFVQGSSVPIPVGGTSASGSITLSGVVSRDATSSVTLDVEVQPIGIAFTGVPTASGGATGAGSPISVTLPALADGLYHWQARTRSGGVTSSWMSFGLNLETDPDFGVQISAPAGGGGGGGGHCGMSGLEAGVFLLGLWAARRRIQGKRSSG